MDENEPFTHRKPGDKQAYKPCKCQKCGVVAYCTPDFDFFVVAADAELGLPDGAPLYCEACFYEVVGIDASTKLEFPSGPFKAGDIIEGKKNGRHAVFEIKEVNEEGDPTRFEEM